MPGSAALFFSIYNDIGGLDARRHVLLLLANTFDR